MGDQTIQRQFNQLTASVKHEVDQYLANQITQLNCPSPILADAMKYALLGGGKRIRPLLCYLVGDCIGIDKTNSLTIACAIECIHAYSLVHDDLPAMDDDDIRRGRPTCHIAFGEAQALLAGDALQSLAFSILTNAQFKDVTPSKQLQLVRLLASAAGHAGMCGGQAIDLAASGEDSAIPNTMETLSELHNLKTGALLKACVLMPLTLNEKISAEHKQLFIQFAENIGLAFQVQDDILDEVGTEAQIGKPQGSDAQANKLTYPALLGIAGAKQELTKLVEQALQALRALPYNVALLNAFCTLLLDRDH